MSAPTPASVAIAYVRDPKGRLHKAQLATATTFDELLRAAKDHFKAERALALVLTERLPKA